MHTHVSTLSFVVTSLYIILFAFLWKLVALRLSDDNPFKGAMLTLFD